MKNCVHRTSARALRLAGLTLVVMMAIPGFSSVRQPAVAGSFYAGSEEALRGQVRSLLEQAGGEAEGNVRAVVVPHAGYVYSGAVAAEAFARVGTRPVSRVIVIGPSHRASFSGGALPKKSVTALRTPLGELPLDQDALAVLRQRPLFDGPASAHDGEH